MELYQWEDFPIQTIRISANGHNTNRRSLSLRETLLQGLTLSEIDIK
jgi:hypothetical protein